MKPALYLLLFSLAFIADRLAWVYFPGYVWILPGLIFLMVAGTEVAEKHFWILIPLFFLTGFISGTHQAVSTLLLIFLSALVFFLRKRFFIEPASVFATVAVSLAGYFIFTFAFWFLQYA